MRSPLRQTADVEVSRAEVLEVIDRLLSGDLTREEASLWAGKRHVEEMADPLVEEALDIVTLIDGRHISSDGELAAYLYDFQEVEAIRASLRDSTG